MRVITSGQTPGHSRPLISEVAWYSAALRQEPIDGDRQADGGSATSDVHPRVTGDLAVVTGRLQRTRTFSGRVASEDWPFRKVYRRDAPGWRVIGYHAWESPR